jgi:hypothetical protein
VAGVADPVGPTRRIFHRSAAVTRIRAAAVVERGVADVHGGRRVGDLTPLSLFD